MSARILEPAMMLGLGVVALWLHVRFPRFRPSTMFWAIGHVGASFGLLMLVPKGIGVCFRAFPEPLSVVVFVTTMLIPTLCYVLLSWVWLIARLHALHDSTPRGGHPVRGSAG
jgi:hypothetical protein